MKTTVKPIIFTLLYKNEIVFHYTCLKDAETYLASAGVDISVRKVAKNKRGIRYGRHYLLYAPRPTREAAKVINTLLKKNKCTANGTAKSGNLKNKKKRRSL